MAGRCRRVGPCGQRRRPLVEILHTATWSWGRRVERLLAPIPSVPHSGARISSILHTPQLCCAAQTSGPGRKNELPDGLRRRSPSGHSGAMLRCQPLAVRQPGAACRLGPASPTCSRVLRRLPGGRAAVRCAAAPEGGATGGSQPPSSRRLSSLEKAAEQERLQRAMLGQQAPFTADRASAGAPHAAAHHSSLAPGASAPQAEPEPGSWEDWMRYFYAMDDVVHDLESLHTELAEAVEAEDYRAAAALAAQRRQLEACDCVGEALGALEAAVAEERFGDAARLRDECCVGLLGWWVGRGDGDPTGHLLRMTTDFGRYVATAYTPRDVTDLLPALQNTPLGDARLAAAAAALLDASSAEAQQEAAAPLRPDDLGLPVLELFLRRGVDGRGYDQQAVALYAPDAALMAEQQQEVADAEAVASTLVDLISTDAGGDSIVSVEKGRNDDGSSFVKIEIASRGEDGDDEGGLPPGGEVARAEGEDEDDLDIRTIDDLAASVGMTAADLGMHLAGGSSRAGADDAEAASAAGAGGEEEEVRQLQRWQQQAAEAAGGEAGAPGRRRSLRDEVAAMTEALLQGGDGGFSDSEAEDAQQQAQQRWGGEEGEEGAVSLERSASQLGCILQRAPAQIEWQGRDRFVVTVSEPPAVARAREAAETEQAATQQQQQRKEEEVQLKRPPLRIIYDGKEQQGLGPNGGAAPPQAGSSSSSSASGSRRQPDGSYDVPITAEESDSEDISVLFSQQQQQQQQQQDGLQPPHPSQQQQQQQHSVAEDSAALAEEIEAVRGELEAGRKPSKDRINDIARRALGLAIAQGVGAADASGNSLAGRWAALEGRTTYERLPLGSCVKTDPFSGLYVGTFGPHGPELLQVSRQVEGGREWAVATKLTGDPNVPAGTVSWKALIGRGNRLPAEMYPPEMAVTARYKGQGQVAQTGFTNAKWVEGELLVFGADSPFVRGAQLGYLIVLHRVDLEELFPEEGN
ncbi:hypothetical protein CHLNCDRAFT_51231 [Chlorella variabilis]|uniref:Uncharacterized protein n=1 Tax=Chlorella variabilis TaxID=554065 RepID=E1ZB40_CHLVA|nr:hypothetical protein CHLNCDRAFT_51231 [Chlorella variabilis]EFN57162.1 hypothetical protein CHLNCDRAFT_51231 [Chlorella variabilis]|eukprot:XP_005849264.1 hypothetical protein CHLNCDRAFT_51231 [Chlorella variabilis]